jgi:hypothetical protein
LTADLSEGLYVQGHIRSFWNSAVKFKCLKCTAFRSNCPCSSSVLCTHIYSNNFSTLGCAHGMLPLVWCPSQLSHCIWCLWVLQDNEPESPFFSLG